MFIRQDSPQPQAPVRVAPQPQPKVETEAKLAPVSDQYEPSLPMNESVSGPMGASFQEGFVEGYLTPSEIEVRVNSLAEEFPNLLEVIDTGIDSHGYDGKNPDIQGPEDLVYLRLGPKDSDRDSKVGIFQYAAPHARERVNPMTMMELTEQLLRNYDPESTDPAIQANTELLDDLDVFVAINTNPDGHNFSAFDEPMWRKNRKPLGNGEYGVDINRNYPYQWEVSDKPASQTFSGAGPASEPETQALLHVVDKHPNIKFVVDWHSYGEEIRRPMGTSAEDNQFYDKMHGRVDSAIKAVAGNDYETVVSQVTKGSSDDHFYHVDNIFSTVMETGEEFIPPENEALVVMQESVAGAREFLEVAQDYAEDTGRA